eukprot:gnl/Carplike_NY0171/489_a674_4164.p1 GENE.gnl/Carplike_NY0171/489_a674_4164~~gnl/Carplike_NY0171/489_a674_4164.p1  ORF type:complete len:137 (-),score=38.58 gnl/Carplike_NY0171/489_a674_4164:75-446(-)
MFDLGWAKNGQIGMQEFVALDAYVTALRQAFQASDVDRSGSIAFAELQGILSRQGFSYNPMMSKALMMAYDRRKVGQISYTRFMDMGAMLGLCRTISQQYDPSRSGKITLTMEQLVAVVLNFV